MFPRKFGRQLFIAEVSENQKGTDGKILHQTISFKSLQNELATSGLAIEQFVHFGAVGFEYAMPKYDLATKSIVLDTRKPIEGVNEVQIEFYGNVAPISLAFAGRSIGDEVDKNDLIVPTIMLPAQPSAFSNSALPSSNYYIAQKMGIELQGRYADYKTAISANANAPFEERQFEGVFTTGDLTGQTKDNPYGETILENHIYAKALDITQVPSSNNYFYMSDSNTTKLDKFTQQTAISTL